MKFINPVYLIYREYKPNNIGEWKPTKIKRKVNADISSISQTEFYKAQSAGLKPEITIRLRSFEYKSEEILEVNNSTYSVLRTFDKGDGVIELVCSKYIGESDEKSSY